MHNYTGLLAVDTHFHVFESADSAALDPNRRYEPPTARETDYLALAKRHSISHAVLVQPSVYGTNNLPLVRMLKLHPNWRGIAVVPHNTSAHSLNLLHKAGVRGLRLNLVQGGGPGLAHLVSLVPQLQRLNWHVQVVGSGDRLISAIEVVAAAGATVVVDHFGWPDVTAGVRAASNRNLIEVLNTYGCWVKCSAAYRLSAKEAPYMDLAPFVHALANYSADRLLWGSDWPHPGHRGKQPIFSEQVNALCAWLGGDERMQNMILSQNPAKLYGLT